MDSINPKKINSIRILGISFVVIIILALIFISARTKISTSQNVENRILKELQSTSTVQASTLIHHLDKQYLPLIVIADMLENGETFASETMQPTLLSLVNAHEVLMIGFADMNGNAVSYTGESCGNISNHTYFSNIANGISTQCYEYLPITMLEDEPKVVFSVPAYQDGQMIGVLFCSIEASALGDSLFEYNELFDAETIIFICDAQGNMIVANNAAHKQCLSVGGNSKKCIVYEQLPELEQMHKDGILRKKVDFHGADAYASLVPLEINDWMLGCIIDETAATKAYATNISNIKNLSNSAMLIFVCASAYILLLSYGFILKNKRETTMIQWYHDNYKDLLREMNCTVIEYTPSTSTFLLFNENSDPYGLNMMDGTIKNYEKFKLLHPEFDFAELEKEAVLVRKHNKAYSFESIIALSDNNELRWVKVLLIPSSDSSNNFKIWGVVLDVTDVHNKFSQAAEPFYQIPGGIHRCYLSEPIHLEYFSDGFCKMLGYTYEEIERILTSERRYALLIHPDDRQIFRNFVYQLAENEGVATCEYRMMCKDGTFISVSDTMESKRSSSGIMYGYSLVTDLQKYKELQRELEQELQKTQQQLEEARIKNSNSQMQPHFLYNALASIREIVLDDPKYASDLIYDFTTHLRACIRSMASESLVSFSQELENIKAYVNIEKMRFGDRLNIQYDCTETEFDIIPLSIQPLVENAIRHGIYERGSDGGTVVIRTFQSDDSFVIQVEDDGVGFDYEETMLEVKNGNKDSTGLNNLIFRLETLLKAFVTVESRIGKGTMITVKIPKGGENHESDYSRR